MKQNSKPSFIRKIFRNESTGEELPVFAKYTDIIPPEYDTDYLDKYEENFDAECKEYIRNSKPDMYNESFYDNKNSKVCLLQKRQLDLQEIENFSFIENSLRPAIEDLIVYLEAKAAVYEELSSEIKSERESLIAAKTKGGE